jgi:prevent-host-death family protein
MQVFSATEAKVKFGLIIDTAQRETVTIEKQGRPYAVIMSAEEYRIIEDHVWALRAQNAEDEGYLSEEESHNFLKKLRRNAKNNSQ